MSIEFSVLDDQRAVLIIVDGDIDVEDVQQMRRRSVELVSDNGHSNFIVDLRNLTSIAQGQTSSIYNLGEAFSKSGFTIWSNTAVLMPTQDAVRKDIELLHIVEINRGRGAIKYVESIDEALSFFKNVPDRRHPD